MKTSDKGTLTEKTTIFFIALFVIGGMTFFPFVADVAKGSGVMVTLFLAFLGAIIAVQIIPGLMLFGMMVKALCGLVHKETVPVESKKSE